MRTLLLVVLLGFLSSASAQTIDDITESEWPETTYVAYWRMVWLPDLSNFFALNLPQAYETVMAAGHTPGPASGLYWVYHEEEESFEVSAAVSFSGDEPEELPEGFNIETIPASTAYSMDYLGPYDGLMAAHATFDEFLAANDLGEAYVVIEEYITDPMSEPDSSKWLTRIHYLFEQE